MQLNEALIYWLGQLARHGSLQIQHNYEYRITNLRVKDRRLVVDYQYYEGPTLDSDIFTVLAKRFLTDIYEAGARPITNDVTIITW